MSKRVKISFGTVDKGKCEIIPPKDVVESNLKIKKHMKEFIRRVQRIK